MATENEVQNHGQDMMKLFFVLSFRRSYINENCSKTLKCLLEFGKVKAMPP